MPISRRKFLGSSAAAAALFANGVMRAAPLGLPLGLQLYSVRDPLQKDYLGTLKQVAALGYQEVEAAGFFGHPVAEVKAAMQSTGLRCVSAHYPLASLKPEIESILAFCESLGVKEIVCSSPMRRKPGGNNELLTLDDWRWNAEQFNQLASKVSDTGMRFAYHNHIAEFHAIDDVLPYDEILQHTDPAKVSFEMDCGWVIVSGHDPIRYLKQYPDRITMLHVKDFKDRKPPSVELGTGEIDYKPIFAAARSGKLRHCFVEQEEFQGPIMAALEVDARYMRQFNP